RADGRDDAQIPPAHAGDHRAADGAEGSAAYGAVRALAATVSAPPLRHHAAPKPEPGFLYSGRGGLKMSSTRAPSAPARMVCGTLPGVRQKSPFLTAISSPPWMRTAEHSSST